MFSKSIPGRNTRNLKCGEALICVLERPVIVQFVGPLADDVFNRQ